MALNHLQIIRLTAAYEMTDGAALYLVVQPTGSKLRRMDFRHLGRQGALHSGAWPDVSIAAARRLLDDARAKLAEGIGPIEAEQLARLA